MELREGVVSSTPLTSYFEATKTMKRIWGFGKFHLYVGSDLVGANNPLPLNLNFDEGNDY